VQISKLAKFYIQKIAFFKEFTISKASKINFVLLWNCDFSPSELHNFILQLSFQTEVFALCLALCDWNYFRKNSWEPEESLKETAQEAIAKWAVDKVKKAEKKAAADAKREAKKEENKAKKEAKKEADKAAKEAAKAAKAKEAEAAKETEAAPTAEEPAAAAEEAAAPAEATAEA